MADQDGKARALIAEAEKNLKPSGFFGIKRPKYEEAGDLYVKAANSYKISKSWKEAGEAFNKAAQCYLNEKENNHNAGQAFVKAFECFSKNPENVKDAILAMEKGISIYTENGRFSMVARYENSLADMYLQIDDEEHAMEHYEKAADFYENDNSPSSANACKLKAAHIAAKRGDYQKAADIFETVGSDSLTRDLSKYSVKEYFFKAGLCILVQGDLILTRKSIDTFCTKHLEFASTRECKFLKDLTDALENYDEEAFDNAVREFDKIIKLDSWKTDLLITMRDKLAKGEEEDLT